VDLALVSPQASFFARLEDIEGFFGSIFQGGIDKRRDFIDAHDCGKWLPLAFIFMRPEVQDYRLFGWPQVEYGLNVPRCFVWTWLEKAH